MPREISAGALVYRNTKRGREYLLLQYEMGHWEFPKGHIEPEESEVETVRREIREETGIARFHFIEGFRDTIKYFYVSKKRRIFKVVVFYLVETRMRTIRLSHEHIGFEWLPFKDAVARATFSNSKTLLRKAEEKLSSPKY